MVPLAMEVFNEHMKGPNQIGEKSPDVNPTAAELLEKPEGNITEAGFRLNVNVGVQYLGGWLAGRGAIPVYGLMEDTATAEISRAQVWQWIHNDAGVFDDGTEVTVELFRKVLAEELDNIRELVGPERFERDEFGKASELFDRISTDDNFVDFLTIPGYQYLD